MNNILYTLSKFLDIDRSLICNNQNDNDKKIFNICYEWAKEGLSLEKNNSIFYDLDLLELNAYELYTSLISNRMFKFNIDDVKNNTMLTHLLNTLQAKSIITQPIFIDNKLDSFIMLIDCDNKFRFWGQQIENLLKTISYVLGIYLKKQQGLNPLLFFIFCFFV